LIIVVSEEDTYIPKGQF